MRSPSLRLPKHNIFCVIRSKQLDTVSSSLPDLSHSSCALARTRLVAESSRSTRTVLVLHRRRADEEQTTRRWSCGTSLGQRSASCTPALLLPIPDQRFFLPHHHSRCCPLCPTHHLPPPFAHPAAYTRCCGYVIVVAPPFALPRRFWDCTPAVVQQCAGVILVFNPDEEGQESELLKWCVCSLVSTRTHTHTRACTHTAVRHKHWLLWFSLNVCLWFEACDDGM